MNPTAADGSTVDEGAIERGAAAFVETPRALRGLFDRKPGAEVHRDARYGGTASSMLALRVMASRTLALPIKQQDACSP